MKKNKLIIVVCLVLSIIGFAPTVDAAYNANVRYKKYNFASGSQLETGILYSACGNGSTNDAIKCPAGFAEDKYKIYNQFIEMGGKSYKSWCIDPALHAENNLAYTCTPYKDAGIDYLFKYASQFQDANGQMDTMEHEMLMSFAFRFYSIYAGIGMEAVDSSGNIVSHNSLTNTKAALIRYLQYKSGMSEIVNNFALGGENQFLKGNDAIVASAFELAKQAMNLRGTSTSDDLESNRSIQYNKISYDNTKVVFNVTSPVYIAPGEIEFICNQGANKGSCSRVEYTWHGTSGVVTVYTDCLLSENSEFGIIARFKQSGVYACYSGPGKQIVMTFINDENATDVPYTDYNPACGNPSCCDIEPINPGHIEGAVANCCIETTHSYAKEYDLDQLFCRHDGLKVDKYWAKCDADYYINNDFELNEYCDMYCTERVTIDIPYAITAKSGRYFTLTKNPVGNTTSPYIEGYKRCRIRVKYDDWERDYIQVVREQVKQYNEYQKYKAFEESYNNLINAGVPNKEFTATVTCTATATAANCKPSGGNPIPGSIPSATSPVVANGAGGGTHTDTKTEECTIKYTKHDINTSSQLENYYGAKILNDNNSETNPVVNNHSSVQMNRYYGGRANFDAGMPSGYVATNVDMSQCNSIVNENQKAENAYTYTTSSGCSSSPVKYTCSIQWTDLQGHVYDIESIRNSYRDTANQYAQKLAEFASNAKTLENKLSQCHNFFNSEKAETVYNFNPAMSFKYSQIYRTDSGKSVLDEINIPFMNQPGCKITGPETGNINYDGGMDTSDPRYSAIYGTGVMTAQDFSGTNLKLDRGISDFNSMLDTAYAANKLFTHDARYKAVCEWEEEPNTVNTLVPNGAVTESTGGNFTLHEQEYKIYLTTYDGTFETDWSITNVGEKGKFDKFLQHSGTNTCSGNTPNSENTFSCTLHVEYEIVYTGKCNGITKNPEDCDPVSNVEGFFQFKVADPKNLFPTGTTANDGKPYAKNWTDTSKGLTAKEKIEETGARGTTYDEARATYKFHFKPADLRHIKNLNVTRNSSGGFTDFEMNCDCPSQVQTNTAVSGGVACTKCKSVLLDDLEDGRIRYDGQTHQVSVWTANKSIDQVRNETWR